MINQKQKIISLDPIARGGAKRHRDVSMSPGVNEPCVLKTQLGHFLMVMCWQLLWFYEARVPGSVGIPCLVFVLRSVELTVLLPT